MKKYFFLYLLACSTGISGQNKSIDSLKTILPDVKSDSQKVNTFNALSREMWHADDYSQAVKFAGRAMSLADSIGYDKGRAGALINLGYVYYSQGSYPEALKNSFDALKICENLRDKMGIGDAYNVIGNVY